MPSTGVKENGGKKRKGERKGEGGGGLESKARQGKARGKGGVER